MKITQFLPAILSLFLLVGIILGYYLEITPYFVVISVSSALLILALSYYYTNKNFKDSLHFTIIGFVLFILIGISSVTFQKQRNDNKHYTKFIQQDNGLILEVKKQLKSNVYNDKFIAEVIQVNQHKTIGSILVHIQKDALTKVAIGNVFYTKPILKTIKKPLNPYQFNYKKHLAKKQVIHQIYTSKDKLYVVKHQNNMYSIADAFRNNITESLKKDNFKKEELSIMQALLLGQRQEVSKELLKNYSNAGAIHILAVSGLHIGIIFYLLSLLFKPIVRIKHGKFIQLILIILCLWLYAVIAGLTPSIIRAVTMFTAVSIGKFSQKRTITLHSLFISMFILLLIHPLYIFSVGFQLSYLAVFSIVYFLPLFLKLYHPKNKIVLFFWQLFAVSVSAQIAILPLSLYYFHQFPSLFFISSMVVIPVLGVILGLGILVIILSLWNVLPIPLANFYQSTINSLNRFIAFVGNQEVFLFKDIRFSLLLLISTYLIVFALYFWMKKPKESIKLVLFSILILQGVLFFEKFQIERSKQFLVFNQFKQSIVLAKNEKTITVFSNMDSTKLFKNYAFHNYMLKKGKLEVRQKLNTSLLITNNKRILIVDSLGIYAIPKLGVDYVILQNSPKINLNRLIKTTKPSLIIADATNYRSYKTHWKTTCEKLNIPFYDTSKSGAYEMNF